MTKHLWEIEHPFYAPGLESGEGEHYKSFKELREYVSDADEDMNGLFRFDWSLEGDKNADPNYRDGKLELAFVQPRHDRYWNPSCDVCAADEPEVIEFLKKKMEYVKKLWEPIV